MGTPQYAQLYIGSSGTDRATISWNDSKQEIVFSTNITVTPTQDLSAMDPQALVTASAVNNALSNISNSITALQSTITGITGFDATTLASITTIQNQLANQPDLPTLMTNVSDAQNAISTLQTTTSTLSSTITNGLNACLNVSPINGTSLYSIQSLVNGSWIEIFKFDSVA